MCLNIALYGRRGARWAMTERGRGQLRRDASTLAIGPSSVHWDGDALSIEFDEQAVPIPRRMRGRVTVHPSALNDQSFALDPQGGHRWQPIATRARIAVDLDRPGLRWRGGAYVDSNFGSESLEEGFVDWQWSRAHLNRESVVFYEGRRRDGSDFALGLRFDAGGVAHPIELPPAARMRPTGWLMPRRTRSDGPARIIRTWEDAPFYSRSALATELFGERVEGVHESLALDRFAHPIVQRMLPFRMPRIVV